MRDKQASWCYQAHDRSWVGPGALTSWWTYRSLGWWLLEQGLEVTPDDLITAGLAEYSPHRDIITGTSVTSDLLALDAEVRMLEDRAPRDWDEYDGDWYFAEEDFWDDSAGLELDLEDWYGLDTKHSWRP